MKRPSARALAAGARRHLRLVVGAALGLAVLAVLALTLRPATAGRNERPTARIRRGSLPLTAYATGELRPSRMRTLVAPSVGGTLQIVKLARTGTRVEEQEIVCQFDPSEQEYNLEQSRSELQEAEQQIARIQAEAAVQAAQDKVGLLTARFALRRAELEVSRNELVSAIDAEKNRLSLEEARRRLEQLEQDARSRQASSLANLAGAEERKNKARLGVQQAQLNIENMTLRAPMAGLVSVKENQDSTGGFFTTGMVLPEYREGDLVQPGRVLADVLVVEEMEILAKVGETDRARLAAGQPVEVRVDTVPGGPLRGKVKDVAGLAARQFFGGDGMKRFDVTFSLDRPDGAIRPGITAQVTVPGDTVKDVLYVPRQALFEKGGQPTVYARTGSGFTAREVKVRQRTESQVVIDGLPEGTEVALFDPEAETKKPAAAQGLPAVAPAR